MSFSQAENKKNAGNDAYKARNYPNALHLYSEAIKLCPENAAYYGSYAFIVSKENSSRKNTHYILFDNFIR